MQEDVQVAVIARDSGGEVAQLLVRGNVARVDLPAAQLRGKLFDFVLHPLALVDKRERRAVSVERAGDRRCDAPAIRDARDQRDLSV